MRACGLFLGLLLCAGVEAFPRAPLLSCSRAIAVGETMMGAPIVSSSSRTVALRRNGEALACGSEVTAGETLEMHISDGSGQLAFELVPAVGSFGASEGVSGGTCDNTRKDFSDGTQSVSVTMPQASGVSVKAAWASGYGQVMMAECVYTMAGAPSPPPPPPPGGAMTITGYLVDLFCWEMDDHIGIDGSNLAKNPEDHTVHCMIDIQSCIDGGYGILEKQGSSYELKYKLDEAGNTAAVELLRGARTRGISKDYVVTVEGVQTGTKSFAVYSIADASYPSNAKGKVLVPGTPGSEGVSLVKDNRPDFVEWRISKDGVGVWACTDYLKAEWKSNGVAAATYIVPSIFILALGLWSTVSFGLMHHVSFVLAIWYLFAAFLFGVHCDTYFAWSTLVIFIIVVLGLILFWLKPSIAKPGSPIYSFFQRRIGVASVIGSKDYGAGKLNDFANMTWAAAVLGLIFLLWVILAVADRHEFYTSGNFMAYDKAMAFGRSIIHGALRLWWLAEASGHKFGIMWGVFGIPYDRMITFHKMSGRLAVLFMIMHSVIMLAKMNYHGYTIDSVLDINRINMPYGILAFIFCVIVGASPLIRRSSYELFYQIHYSMKFLLHIAMILHAPRWVIPFSAGLVVSYYFDACLKLYATSVQKSTLVSATVVADDEANNVHVTRLEIDKPMVSAVNKWHPGSFLTIALGLPIKSMSAHPYTIASPPASNKIVLMVRNMAKGQDEWSDQVYEMAKKGIDVSTVNVKLGALAGRLEIEPSDFSTIMLCAGGIGVTPMASLLGDIALAHQQKYPQVKKVKLFWAVRSHQLVSAFAEWFEYAENCKTVEWDLNVFVTKSQSSQSKQVSNTGNTLAPGVSIQSAPGQQMFPAQHMPGPYGPGAQTHMPMAAVPMQIGQPMPQTIMHGQLTMAIPNAHGYMVQGMSFGNGMPANVKVQEGRPNFSALVEQEATAAPPGSYVGVFSCGPGPLMADVAQACAGHSNVFTHQESFEW